MSNNTNTGSKKQTNVGYKNTFEKIGSGFFDQLTGAYDDESYQSPDTFRPSKDIKRQPLKQDNRLFNYQEYYEHSIVKRQIQELTEQIKKEMQLIKKENKALLSEVKDVEKLTIESLPEKPGIYHIRFLEVILNIIRLLRKKVSESNTWLQAMISRKKKRGSLFAVRAKSKGTQYSLSQELQLTRQTG